MYGEYHLRIYVASGRIAEFKHHVIFTKSLSFWKSLHWRGGLLGEGIHGIKRRDWAHGKYIIIRVPGPDGDVFQRVVDVENNSASQNITRPDDTELVFPGLRISPYTGMVVYDGQ